MVHELLFSITMGLAEISSDLVLVRAGGLGPRLWAGIRAGIPGITAGVMVMLNLVSCTILFINVVFQVDIQVDIQVDFPDFKLIFRISS